MSKHTLFRTMPYAVILSFTTHALTGCNGKTVETQSFARPVKLYRVTNEDGDSQVSYAGEIKARHETALAFRVGGKMLSRTVDNGDAVNKGQVLATLDPIDYRLAEQAIKAQLTAAKAESAFAKDDLQRYRDLLQQKVISAPDYDKHETRYTAAREKVAALTAQLKQTVNQLNYTQLIADRDGIITATPVEKDQVVAAGQPILTLATTEENEVHFDVPEDVIRTLTVGEEVSVSFWRTHSANSRLAAQIREIAASADPGTRTFKVKAKIPANRADLQLGMSATVFLPAKKILQIVVPRSAIFSPQNQPGQTQAWLFDDKTHQVKAVPVALGLAKSDERISVSGLSAGQQIVSAGVHRIQAGQKVRVLNEYGKIVDQLSMARDARP